MKTIYYVIIGVFAVLIIYAIIKISSVSKQMKASNQEMPPWWQALIYQQAQQQPGSGGGVQPPTDEHTDKPNALDWFGKLADIFGIAVGGGLFGGGGSSDSDRPAD